MPMPSFFDTATLWDPFILSVAVSLIIATFFFLKVPKERRSMIVTIVLFYIAFGSPLAVLSDISFIYHMLQMVIVFLVIPAFVWNGLPIRIVQKIAYSHTFKILSKPIVALIVFNGLFSFYHIPTVFDTMHMYEGLHFVFYTMLFCASMIVWWHVFDRVNNGRNISNLKKIAYIFVNGMLITPACALIIFSSEPMYAAYASTTMHDVTAYTSEFFLNIPVMNDQKGAGVLMKISQEIIYVVFIGLVFFRWVKEEKMKL